jgi:pSer/pThr/pTyr-binding forkhead associated (FHA) protein
LLPAAQPAAAVPASGWELTVQSGPDLGRRYELAGEARVGRSVECEVALADGTASRVHARIRQESGAFWISDNQSMNGTEVNGARIAGSVRLNEGDLIHVGSSDLVFGRAPGCAPVPFPTAATEPAPVQAAHDAPAPAAPVCPACASPVGKGAAFCTNCGRALL